MKGVIFINTSPDKDPSGSTEKRGEEEEERGEVEGGCWGGGGSFWHQCAAIDCVSHYQYMIQSKKREEERHRERAFLLPCHQITKTSPL